MKVKIETIVFDPLVYPRKDLSPYNVLRLAQAIEAGATVPPITIESDTKRLVDGWHRLNAFKRLGLESIDATVKKYASDAELFADAVRLNISHGEHLDQYSVRNAIIRLQQYGLQRAEISEIVRLPIAKIEKIERGFAISDTGRPVALKSGMEHFRGETLKPEQQQMNRDYSGPKAVFHARLLSQMIESDSWPRSDTFITEMDRLVELWQHASAAKAKGVGDAA